MARLSDVLISFLSRSLIPFSSKISVGALKVAIIRRLAPKEL